MSLVTETLDFSRERAFWPSAAVNMAHAAHSNTDLSDGIDVGMTQSRSKMPTEEASAHSFCKQNMSLLLI
jgi:hypothetical protein